MKYFNQFVIFGLLCVLQKVFCTDNVYERVSSYIEESNIVDPHSLYYNRHSQVVKVPKGYKNVDGSSNEIQLRDTDNYQSYCRDSQNEVFARRLINMLILKSNFKMTNDIAIGNLDLEATFEELEILKAFGEGKISIRQIDGIIDNIVRPAQISLFDEAMNYTDRLSVYIYQYRIIFGAALLIIFVTIMALKVQWTRLRVIFLIFDIMFIISFMLTWWELLLESEIKLTAQQKIYSTMPDECRQNEIDFFKSVGLFFGFGKGDCFKYFEAVMSDPALKVTPLHAFSHMCTKFFLHPLAVLGHYLSNFIENITSQLPFPLNIIAKTILVLFMPGLLSGLLFVSLGGSVGLRLGPFLHVYLHGKQVPPPSNSLANSDRQAIEIIRSETQEVAASPTNTKPALRAKESSPKAEECSIPRSERYPMAELEAPINTESALPSKESIAKAEEFSISRSERYPEAESEDPTNTETALLGKESTPKSEECSVP